MADQYIYVMKDLRKIYPPNREVLKGIWLSFLPGAKIGGLGLNGAGKSTLLKIMAGVVTDFGGEAWPAKGVRVGFLQQEPQLDESKDVLGNVEEGVAGTRALLTRFDQINARFAEDLAPEEMEKLLEEQARVQDAIDAANAWELDRTLEIAMDALRGPPCCCSTSRPIISTRSRWPGWSPSSRNIPARWWRSPTIATSSTTWPAGSSSWTAAAASRGRATTPPGWRRRSSAWRSRRSRNPLAGGPCSASSNGCG